MFSVVIPSYNHRRFLVSCLLSATRSRLVDEVLVVDDGSADRSTELLAELSRLDRRIKLLPNDNSDNRGAHYRLNELVAMARNEWIAVLNSDDEFVPGRFEAIQQPAGGRAADLHFGDLVIIDRAGEPHGVRRAVIDNEYPWPEQFDAVAAAEDGSWIELLLQQNIIATTTNMVFSRPAFERVGGFRPYRYCHDWDFAIRVALQGSVKYAPLMMSRYRVHPGNTIREARCGVDTEVGAMFARLAAEFPQIRETAALRAACMLNRYLHPPRVPWLEIVRSSNVSAGAAEASLPTAELDVSFVTGPSAGAPDDAYVYAPGAGLAELTANDLRNLRLALAVRAYDVLLLSRSMQPHPEVGATSVQDLIVYSRRWTPTESGPARARLMRLLPATRDAVRLGEVVDAGRLLVDHASADCEDDGTPWSQPLRLPERGLGSHPGKPTVFVCPVFLAMGGAERLVIETMRHLASEYHFVVINTEPLTPAQGSMHAEALHYADIYDLAETVRRQDRLQAIELLRREYEPIVVWICNGSPWQVAHAADLRSIFADTAIVDNQVYDHEHGWIGAFSDPAVRSADRFVAINGRIRRVMQERFAIPEDRIDLIYHGASISHLRPGGTTRAAPAATRRRLQLPVTGMLFGMVGRLTPQKRPQDLIHLAARIQASGADHHFLWAGPGEMRGEMERLSARVGALNISLLQPLQDVRPLYEALDGLIVTSEFEGLPFVVLEALALGIPVLSTPVGAIEEVLGEYGSGRISGAPGDLDALEAAFLAFVDELPALRATAEACREQFIDQFSSERMAAEYRASWMRAIDGRRDRG